MTQLAQFAASPISGEKMRVGNSCGRRGRGGRTVSRDGASVTKGAQAADCHPADSAPGLAVAWAATYQGDRMNGGAADPRGDPHTTEAKETPAHQIAEGHGSQLRCHALRIVPALSAPIRLVDPSGAEKYVGWVKRFVAFHGRKHPAEPGAA